MGFPFWVFIGICFTPIIGCACLSLCYFESAIRRKQEKERQQRETELHKKWADIAHQNDFEDNDDQSTAHYAPYVDSPEGNRSISRSNSSAYSAPIRSPTGISSAGAMRSPPHSSTKNQNQSFMSKLASGFSMSKPRGQSENMSALQGAIHNTPPPLQKMEVGEGSLDSKGSRKDTSRYCPLLFSTILHYSLLSPTIPFVYLFYSLLFSTILYYSLIYSLHLFPTILYYSLLFSTIPYYSPTNPLLFPTAVRCLGRLVIGSQIPRYLFVSFNLFLLQLNFIKFLESLHYCRNADNQLPNTHCSSFSNFFNMYSVIAGIFSLSES